MGESVTHGFLVTAIIVTLAQCAYSDNIVFYFGLAHYSHKLAVWPLVETLAARGHTVTFISPYPQKEINPNVSVTEINPRALTDLMSKNVESAIVKRMNGLHYGDWYKLPTSGEMVCQAVLTSPEFKSWISKTSKIDLVFIDGLFNECGLGIAHKYKAKFVLIQTGSQLIWTPESMGTVSETSWIPDMQFHYETPMSFMNRVVNTLRPLYWQYWLRQTNYFPNMETIMKKELGIPDMPPLKELERNTSLVFLSTHYSIEYARSLPPFYVPIGGMHIVESHQKLPKDISDFIKGSGPGGVIYVSFGSAAKSSKIPTKIKTILYEVFGSFKSHRFIWRFDIDRPKDLPANIMIVKWAPQQEILAHKNVKAFISHAGYGSIKESTYYGVPMIVFPLFGDQDYNANIIEKTGCGIKLEIVGITGEGLRNAIKNILEDGRYTSKMMEASSLFQDRPMKPLDTAVWWTEYVLRHNDVSSLKPFSVHQTWYERRHLDVWLFMFSVVVGFITTLYIIFKCVCRKNETKYKKS